MTTIVDLTLQERLTQLLQHLGLSQAHFAARTLSDWDGLATTHPECITSMSLICPGVIDVEALRSVASRFLLVVGDRGPAAQRVRGSIAEFSETKIIDLPGYSGLIWDDAIADHPETIRTAMTDFLNHMSQQQGLTPVKIPAGAGEHAGLFYHIQGEGPPLVLLPLGLAPSQWDPLLAALSQNYCTIVLGGPTLGTVSILESRSRAGYLSIVRRLVDEIAPQPDESILEVGCGSGALTRWIAHQNASTPRVVGADVNPYLLREARLIAQHEKLADVITFEEGSAEALPFPEDSFNITISCTMLEEVDAERSLAEMVRVTSPGGRVGIIVRALDMPWWVNLPVEASLKTVLESPSRLGAGVQAQGCADASLYKRMKDIGLGQVRMFPQWAVYTEGSYFQVHREKLLMNLSPEDTQRGQEALAQANADGTFLMAEPFHCAVGTKL